MMWNRKRARQEDFQEEKEKEEEDKIEESIFKFHQEFINFKNKGHNLLNELEDYKRIKKSLLKKIESRTLELKHLEEDRNSVLNKINISFVNSNDIIKFDVGGTIFSTSKQTLMKNNIF